MGIPTMLLGAVFRFLQVEELVELVSLNRLVRDCLLHPLHQTTCSIGNIWMDALRHRIVDFDARIRSFPAGLKVLVGLKHPGRRHVRSLADNDSDSDSESDGPGPPSWWRRSMSEDKQESFDDSELEFISFTGPRLCQLLWCACQDCKELVAQPQDLLNTCTVCPTWKRLCHSCFGKFYWPPLSTMGLMMMGSNVRGKCQKCSGCHDAYCEQHARKHIQICDACSTFPYDDVHQYCVKSASKVLE
jgi:hypothetical protein